MGGASLMFFILVGITAPKTEIPQTAKEKGDIVVTSQEKNTAEINTPTQPVSQDTKNQETNRINQTRRYPRSGYLHPARNCDGEQEP